MIAIEVIEDLLPLRDVRVSLKLDHAVRGVTLEPEGIVNALLSPNAQRHPEFDKSNFSFDFFTSAGFFSIAVVTAAQSRSETSGIWKPP